MGGRGRGSLTVENDRTLTLQLISQAVVDGARKKRACEELGVDIRTIQRWEKQKTDKRFEAKRAPKNELTQYERDQIIEISCSERFKNVSPKAIVPILAEEGRYIASESSYYRILRKEKMVNHREKSKIATKKRPNEIEATKPDQVWSWDITYLQTAVKGMFFFLYMIMDIYSRKIVGWSIHDREDNIYSSELLKSTTSGKRMPDLYLHSDNGGPMRGATFMATMQTLGITPSYSRPRCSNDNAFSESLFKTLKYRISYPKAFNTIDEAKKWVSEFVEWYNTEHRHSGIGHITPNQKHAGKDVEILKKRRKTYEEAKRKNPERWIKDKIRDWKCTSTTVLNKKKTKKNVA